jgi:hypothetical protein
VSTLATGCPLCRTPVRCGQVLVCPLIPMILLDGPGLLARELSEFAAWLATVYDNNLLGMQGPRAAVVSASENLSPGR